MANDKRTEKRPIGSSIVRPDKGKAHIRQPHFGDRHINTHTDADKSRDDIAQLAERTLTTTDSDSYDPDKVSDERASEVDGLYRNMPDNTNFYDYTKQNHITDTETQRFHNGIANMAMYFFCNDDPSAAQDENGNPIVVDTTGVPDVWEKVASESIGYASHRYPKEVQEAVYENFLNSERGPSDAIENSRLVESEVASGITSIAERFGCDLDEDDARNKLMTRLRSDMPDNTDYFQSKFAAYDFDPAETAGNILREMVDEKYNSDAITESEYESACDMIDQQDWIS